MHHEFLTCTHILGYNNMKHDYTDLKITLNEYLKMKEHPQYYLIVCRKLILDFSVLSPINHICSGVS